ncbi:hypothetical protein GOBAR_AA20799 [Gossypium barbadense]|uniref:SWIM-type domain-containing protein n=1 Tax=Gossypium barbadense TaxID=3634 RepID=A0A2P5X957_GOSBA|nr:hypothetical protein GOBAR_AA20799 [Gossypium barbadense]
MTRLESDMEVQTNTSFQQWLGTMEPWQWAQKFDKGFRYETIGRRPGIPPRSYGVDFQNRRCDYRRFQTLYYPCAHVVAVCTKVSLNVEKFVDYVYTLERTLRACENEFPVLPDLSMQEVPPTTFELVPDKGLRRNPEGRSQSSRIHNEMDIT